jgi:hypothetical protein
MIRVGVWCEIATSLGVSECSAARYSELVSELVSELGTAAVSPCELLLLETGS